MLQALKIEKANYQKSKTQLEELHKNYGERIETLKQENKELLDTKNALERQGADPKFKADVESKTQREINNVILHLSTLQQQLSAAVDSRNADQVQLSGIRNQNQKLVITINALKPTAEKLRSQYEGLCKETADQMKATSQKLQPQMSSRNSPAENVIALLQYFDIALADNLVCDPAEQLVSASMNPQMMTDPWFTRIAEENQAMERKIRILLHILEQERRRCNLRAMIKGKPYVAPMPNVKIAQMQIQEMCR
jgi:chromosome segregation ATPase